MIKKAAIAIVVLLAAGAARAARRVGRRRPKTIPTAHVQRGRVQVTVYTVGDLRAVARDAVGGAADGRAAADS